jgi:hypothetical protein
MYSTALFFSAFSSNRERPDLSGLSATPDLDNMELSNTTGHRLRTGDAIRSLPPLIEPLDRLMPSGVQAPLTVTSVLGTPGE